MLSCSRPVLRVAPRAFVLDSDDFCPLSGWISRAIALAATLALCATATAAPYIVLGSSDGVALDQPRGGVRWLDGASSLGPDYYNEFLFDTGANSIVAFGWATDELEGNGYETEGTFEEQGVGGFVTYNVSAPYTFQFAGSDGDERTIHDVRTLSTQTGDPPSVGSFMGIAGMPVMVNRVTTLDFSGWSGGLLPDFSNLFMGVEFLSALPASQGHRYGVDVTPMPFGPHGEEPLPIWAPVPFVTATAQLGSVRRSGGFLFDTGAQMSMLSTELATELGLDSNGDGQLGLGDDNYLWDEEVGGIGEPVVVPVFLVDAIRLATNEGVDLVWTDAPVIVMDIHADIKGIVGSDLLTSGWLEALFYEGPDGYLRQVQLDFRGMMDPVNPGGTIYFDLSPAVDQVVYPPRAPGDANDDGRVDQQDAGIMAGNWGKSVTGGANDGDFNGDGRVDAADAALLTANWSHVVLIPGDANGDGKVDQDDADILALNWGESVNGGMDDGDFNGDGLVNAADAAILTANWGYGAEAAVSPAVPEPSSLALLAAAAIALLARPAASRPKFRNP